MNIATYMDQNLWIFQIVKSLTNVLLAFGAWGVDRCIDTAESSDCIRIYIFYLADYLSFYTTLFFQLEEKTPFYNVSFIFVILW